MGIVEGLTEFLPVSSTGHLIIVNHFLEFKEPFASLFEIVIQMGAILSVLIYFRRRFNPLEMDEVGRMELFAIIVKTCVAVFPALALGALFGGKIKDLLFNPVTVALALLIGGILLVLIEKLKSPGKAVFNELSSIDLRTAFLIGVFQCLALVPGTSRSAATIIGAMILGCSRKSAAEFSFYLAVPTLSAASVYSIYKHHEAVTASEWGALGVGFAVSFIVALASIAFLMKYIQKHDFVIFGYYRIALAVLVLIFCSGK